MHFIIFSVKYSHQRVIIQKKNIPHVMPALRRILVNYCVPKTIRSVRWSNGTSCTSRIACLDKYYSWLFFKRFCDSVRRYIHRRFAKRARMFAIHGLRSTSRLPGVIARTYTNSIVSAPPEVKISTVVSTSCLSVSDLY